MAQPGGSLVHTVLGRIPNLMHSNPTGAWAGLKYLVIKYDELTLLINIMCVFMCVRVHMYVQVRVHLCARACGGQRTTLSVASDTESLPGSEFTKYSFCTISYTVWTCSVRLWWCVPIVSGLRDASGRLGVQGYIRSYIKEPSFSWSPQDPYKKQKQNSRNLSELIVCV